MSFLTTFQPGPIAGTAAVTLDALTGTETGVLLIQGAEAKTLDALTVTATATLLIQGSASATLDALTGSAESTVTGAGEAPTDTLADRLRRAKGFPISSKGLPGSSYHRRRRRRDIEIVAKLRARRPRVIASGETTAPPEGELRGSVGIPLELRCRVVIGTAGRGRLALPGPAITARVFLAPCGDARLILTPTVNARGWHDHFTDEEIDHASMTLLLAA